MRSICLVFTLALFGVISAQAEYPWPPLEAYGALPRIADAEISPDGKRVATIANLEDGARMIVFTLSGDAAPKQVGIGKIKARSVEFFDNAHVIFRARLYGRAQRHALLRPAASEAQISQRAPPFTRNQ